MITSKDCYLKDTCVKYSRDKSCDADIFCRKLFKIDKLYDEALLSSAQRKHVEFKLTTDELAENFNKLKAFETNIVDNVNQGRNLYIHSANCGNGKTTWSIRMIQSYIGKIWTRCDVECKALFINVPRFLLALKDSITNQSDYIDHIKANILKADLIVWDDIATKALTTFEAENLLSMIDARINMGKSNIYTSNLNPEELAEKLGDRLYSRVVNLSIDVEFKGYDKRGLM